ncbi:MAG: hypothetical protein JWP44_742 [Mucilaginibacter sp.]|nr:hypothetical protein [Mucilaginibacter sp.]
MELPQEALYDVRKFIIKNVGEMGYKYQVGG